MSCRRAEKLMPLYAAGDLPAGRAERAVAAHVAGCASCAGLAAEFRAGRVWAREAGAVPEFGEEFYERLRAGVLDRVGRDTRPAAPSRFVTHFGAMFAGRRLAYAASLALAACALAVAFYVSRGAVEPQKKQAAVATPVNEPGGPAPANLPPLPTPRPVWTREPEERQQQQSTRGAARFGKRPPRPAGDVTGGGFKRTPTLRHAAPARDPVTARVLTASSGSGARREAAAAAPRAETASVSRIEIQTADPSIRIIWLAPGGGSEPEPDRVDPNR